MNKIISFIFISILSLTMSEELYLRRVDKKLCKNNMDCRKNTNCVDGVVYCECIKGKCYFE